jgi:hypothetical protein
MIGVEAIREMAEDKRALEGLSRSEDSEVNVGVEGE